MAAHLSYSLALGEKNFCLPEMRDDLFRCKSLSGHEKTPFLASIGF
jgi:hypothetical protein